MNTRQDVRTESILVEARDIQLELSGVPLKIAVFKPLLAMEEQFVHLPEPALEGSCLGCRRRGEGVRVYLCEREMAKGEADTAVQSLLDPLDFSKRLSRVRAFVVAVLEDETTGGWAADVIDLVVEGLDAWLTPLRDGLASHQNPTTRRMRTT
jgi:hypothetical protein